MSKAVGPLPYTRDVRLDRALRADLGRASGSTAIRLFLLVELAAGVLFVIRRGGDQVATVLLVWVGMVLLGFFAWWAGRHRLAHPTPDPVPDAGFRSICALVAACGLVAWGFGLGATVGFLLFIAGMGGWLVSAIRREGWRVLPTRLLRDPRPFVPMLLLIAAPRLVVGGIAFVSGAMVALPSGIGQQLLYLVGLFAPLEAARSRTAPAAVLAALVFGLIHVPLNLDANHGDVLAAAANAVFFQASVGLVACLAFTRHRAVLPIGVAHALAIG
jgi:hypothetical protein